MCTLYAAQDEILQWCRVTHKKRWSAFRETRRAWVQTCSTQVRSQDSNFSTRGVNTGTFLRLAGPPTSTNINLSSRFSWGSLLKIRWEVTDEDSWYGFLSPWTLCTYMIRVYTCIWRQTHVTHNDVERTLSLLKKKSSMKFVVSLVPFLPSFFKTSDWVTQELYEDTIEACRMSIWKVKIYRALYASTIDLFTEEQFMWKFGKCYGTSNSRVQ